MLLLDRTSAGEALASRLLHLKDERPVVLALPRGGVPVALQIATALSAPLYLLPVRKIGAPWSPDFGIGAVVDTDPPEVSIDRDVAHTLMIPDTFLATKRRADRRGPAGARAICRTARARTSPAAPSSWSMTASPPAARCGLPCVPWRTPRAALSPCPWRRPTWCCRFPGGRRYQRAATPSFGSVGTLYDDFRRSRTMR